MGVFARMMAGLAADGEVPKTVMIDAITLKAHRTASSLRAKRGPGSQPGRLIGRPKGGLNTKLHAVTDGDGRPLRFLPRAPAKSATPPAPSLLSTLPKADWLLADRGYDADWFRDALADKGIKPCIPGRSSRERPIKHDRRRYRRRHRIEMMFGRLRDWLRVATRYDRCPIVFLSAIALAATVMVWL